MIDFLLNIFGEIILPGVIIAVVFGGAYFAIWRGKRKAYVIANLILATGVGVCAALVPVDTAAPFPAMVFFVFLIGLALQVGIVALVCAISWFRERHKKRKAEQIGTSR